MALAGTARAVVIGMASSNASLTAMASGIPSCSSASSLRSSLAALHPLLPMSLTTASSSSSAITIAASLSVRCRALSLRARGLAAPPSCPRFPPWSSSAVGVVAFSSSSSSASSSIVEETAVQEPPSVVGSTEGGPPPVAAPLELDALDIRVGRVLKAWKHPEADSLYVEEVDLAEPEGPRTICSGLVNYLSLEELQGRAVLVLANLKARNMRGVKSNGMLLAASNAEHTTVQLLSPPEGAEPGERVWFGEETDQAEQAPPGTPNQVQKKKVWESIQPLLKTTEDCVATFQAKPMRTSGGVVTCESLQGANIS